MARTKGKADLNSTRNHFGDAMKEFQRHDLTDFTERAMFWAVRQMLLTYHGALPENELAKLLGARTETEQARLREFLEGCDAFYVVSEGNVDRWRMSLVDDERAETAEFIERKAQAGRKGAEARYQAPAEQTEPQP